MATYVIGDVQGCFSELQKLLAHIQFDPSKDKLWFTGDLVNRGPQSLEVLRFVKSLGRQQQIVLGNHDLHLLAVAHHSHVGWSEDTFGDVLRAPDCDELMRWLCQQPLFYHDARSGYSLVHAGLAANWDLQTAQQLSDEVSAVIQDSAQAKIFFQHMYGNEPRQWDAVLTGWDRLRCITNYFTRLRFCREDGHLELSKKGTVDSAQELIPWFQVPNRKNKDLKIIFGHWAALGGVTNTLNTYALDTGCIWGYCLTAMRLEDERRFSVQCSRT